MTGWPVSTMVRGKFVVRDGALVGKEGAGEYVAREKSPLAKPRGNGGMSYGTDFAVACSISASSPFTRSIGFGGQPLMTRSTGTTLSTAPTVA